MSPITFDDSAADVVKAETEKALERQSAKNVDAKVKTKGEQIRDRLEQIKPALQSAIPNREVSVEYLVSTALTLLRSDDKLRQATPDSIAACVIQAAQLDLRLDNQLGQIHMIPYGGEAQLQIGYRGLVELALRSRNIVKVMADIVYEKDFFEYERGTNEHLYHRPARGYRGEIIYTYAYATLIGGAIQFDVLEEEDIERAEASSKMRGRGPWKTHRNEMRKKTAIKRLSKMLPMSIEFEKARELDDLTSAGLPQKLAVDDAGEVSHTPVGEIYTEPETEDAKDTAEQKARYEVEQVLTKNADEVRGKINAADSTDRLDKVLDFAIAGLGEGMLRQVDYDSLCQVLSIKRTALEKKREKK